MKKLNITLILLTGVVFLLSLRLGVLEISFWKALVGQAGQSDNAVLWQIRFPRTLLAWMTGITLGLSGAAMQGLLRNPLADSGLLGISGGAVTGAMLALYSGLSGLGVWLLPAGGFLGALLAAVLILVFCLRRTSLLGLILAGAALNTFFFAASSLILNFSKNPYAVLEIIYWQMGSFENRTLSQAITAAPWMIAGWILLFSTAPALRLLTLGEETARTAGVSMPSTLNLTVLGTALCVGAAVSICGSIAFVGLLMPHLMRSFVKSDPGKLLSVSAMAGGIFLIAADICCRLFSAGAELKIGVLTALFGAPFFILLAFKTKKTAV